MVWQRQKEVVDSKIAVGGDEKGVIRAGMRHGVNSRWARAWIDG